MKNLKKYKAILFDGDGVLWKKNQPLPGLQEIFELISKINIQWALITNNNTYTVEDCLDKLTGFGIPAKPHNVYTSSTAAAKYILDKYGQDSRLHVIGVRGLTKTLEDAGFKFSQGEEIPAGDVKAVVAGMDPLLTYQKVTTAVRLILEGAEFIATNTDGTYPTPDGIYPGTGMVIGALHYSSGVEPQITGKPHPFIFRTALQALGVQCGETLMVGDRLNTDILGAGQVGIDTAAVLTGITSLDEISHSDIKPDFIFEDLISLRETLSSVYNQ